MSVHFILDGYNVIQRVSALVSPKLETSRDNLIKFITKARPQGSPNNPVTIVFDGQSGLGERLNVTGVQVVFSSDDSADEEIKRIVAEAKNRKNITVVTDDRAIQYYVRALGANVVSVYDFFAKAHLTSPPDEAADTTRPRNINAAGKNISKVVEHKINLELEEFWLKRKKKK